MMNLFAAGLAFLPTHLGINSTPLRDLLARRLGERGYLVLYSLIAFAALGWLVVAFNQTPHTSFLWPPALAWRVLALLTGVSLLTR